MHKIILLSVVVVIAACGGEKTSNPSPSTAAPSDDPSPASRQGRVEAPVEKPALPKTPPPAVQAELDKRRERTKRVEKLNETIPPVGKGALPKGATTK